MATVMPRRCVCQAQSLVSTLPARHFSASPLAFVSQAKIKARQRIKAKRSQKEAQQKDFERHRPDPILGYPVQIPDGHAAWEGCELKKLIVSREDVWSGKAAEATGARLLNFGLKDGHATFLFEALPDVSAQRVVLGEGSVFDEGAGAKIEEASAAEQRKRQTLEKILDMRNADSKAIERFNIGRIVDVFSKHQDSRHELDPGCPEVQAAVLTYRIHYLLSFLWNNITDIHNRRTLTRYVMQRKHVLSYLKRRSAPRYDAVLPRLGLVPRAVEGEITIRKGLPPRPGQSKY